MIIHIRELRFECIIGILHFERLTPQEVIVNCNITYTYSDTYINYAEVAEHIESQMQKLKFELIEEALPSLSKSLKNAFPQIEHLQLEIIKPNIMNNCIVSVEEAYQF